jgi:hypothetical protein
VTNPATITNATDNSKMVFTEPSGEFYHDVTTSRHLSGLTHLDNFYHYAKLIVIYRDYAKTYANLDLDDNLSNRRAVLVYMHQT